MHDAFESNALVTQEMIFACCDRSDVCTLRFWASQGVPVLLGGALLVQAAAAGKIAVVRFLLEELGANVNLVDADGTRCDAHAGQ
jgi:hypothetical protein